MKISTSYVLPPIPSRAYDWIAVDDDTYEGGGTLGHGPTEQAAIDDLMERIREQAEEERNERRRDADEHPGASNGSTDWGRT